MRRSIFTLLRGLPGRLLSTTGTPAEVEDKLSEIIFLGTGSSIGTPHLYNLMIRNKAAHKDPRDLRGLDISVKATVGDPKCNKNYRCNPSILVRFREHGGTGGHKNILIDCCKTFRESAIRWFPEHDIRSVDGVLLTHGHADAIFGIDDLRSTQPRAQDVPLEIYQSAECREVTKAVFSYLYPKECSSLQQDEAVGSGDSLPNRFVAKIDWKAIVPFSPVVVGGCEFLPLPVMHGEDLVCMGFLFGRRDKVLYLSDISRMLPDTLKVIQEHIAGQGIRLLIVDALGPGKSPFANSTHYFVEDALDLARILRPNKTMLIGMSHAIDHDRMNEHLRKCQEKDGLDVELSYDGLAVNLRL